MIGSKGVSAKLHLHTQTKLSVFDGFHVHIGKEVLAAVELGDLKFRWENMRLVKLSVRADFQMEVLLLKAAGVKLKAVCAFRAAEQLFRVVQGIGSGRDRQHL